jgi:hypothetical protein
MKDLQDIYTINDELITKPDYYLGNDDKKDWKGRWCIGCKKYLKEAIQQGGENVFHHAEEVLGANDDR